MTTTRHPQWCGRGHYCTATYLTDRPGRRAYHRSEPFRLDTAWGGLITTLVATATGDRAWLEIRLTVAIPAQQDQARLRADQIAVELDHAVTSATFTADINAYIASDPQLAALTQGSRREVTR